MKTLSGSRKICDRTGPCRSSGIERREMLLSDIRAEGHETVGFDDLLTTLGALDADCNVRVTCVQSDSGKRRPDVRWMTA